MDDKRCWLRDASWDLDTWEFARHDTFSSSSLTLLILSNSSTCQFPTIQSAVAGVKRDVQPTGRHVNTWLSCLAHGNGLELRNGQIGAYSTYSSSMDARSCICCHSGLFWVVICVEICTEAISKADSLSRRVTSMTNIKFRAELLFFNLILLGSMLLQNRCVFRILRFSLTRL